MYALNPSQKGDVGHCDCKIYH